MVDIIELDTRSIIGHYVPRSQRIEISKYLREYPELFTFVLEHEQKHSQLSNYSFKHIWIDIRDRTKFFINITLIKQWIAFNKPDAPKGWKENIFIFLYNFLGIIQVFQMLLIIPTILRQSDKWKNFKNWLQNWLILLLDCFN
jgi:hypothetical protein